MVSTALSHYNSFFYPCVLLVWTFRQDGGWEVNENFYLANDQNIIMIKWGLINSQLVLGFHEWCKLGGPLYYLLNGPCQFQVLFQEDLKIAMGLKACFFKHFLNNIYIYWVKIQTICWQKKVQFLTKKNLHKTWSLILASAFCFPTPLWASQV